MKEDTVRLLLVEDNEGDTRLIRELLREDGAQDVDLLQADRLSVARQMLAEQRVDVMLLDLNLPDSVGIDTVAGMTAHAKSIPVVVLTGLDDEAVGLEAIHYGVQDYLSKNELNARQLWRAIRYSIERKQSERAVRDSEQRLQTVINNAPVMFFAVDDKGMITTCRGRGLEALGQTPEALEGRAIRDALRNNPDVEVFLREVLDGERKMAMLNVDGVAFQSFAMPVPDENGAARGVIGVATDVTERVRAEEAARRTADELQARNEELESFTYSVSHDLKEPLRTLEAFSQFLLEDHSSRLDPEGRDYLERITKASGRLKRMLDDLLLLSRLSRRPEDIDRVDVERVVRDSIASMSLMIDERNASVELENELPEVVGERSRVEQIFGNLITNGLKFNSSDRPVVSIGARLVDGDRATYIIRDNGIGIEEQYQDRIFGVFQQLHRREQYGGTGAGLAIVQRAVSALGGEIRVESELSRGSTFSVTLPVAEVTRQLANAA